MNREADFREFLIESLKEKFQISDEQNLLLYLCVRYTCVTGKKEIYVDSFMKFVMRELYILDEPNGVLFDNQLLTYSFAVENSLYNIYDEWYFNLYKYSFTDFSGNKLDLNHYKESVLKDITKKARQKAQKYKTSQYKDKILTYFKLMTLNEHFEVVLNAVENTNLVSQLEIRLSDEELLERYLQAENFNSNNIRAITESDLRDYLYVNLNLLEVGLTPIGKEIQANEGRLDILARDKDNNIVIIELKTEIDKRLVWQCLYYPEVVKTKYLTRDKIRIITVCPEYPEYLLTVLKKIPDMEMFQFQVVSTNHQIEHLEFNKVN